MLVRHVFRSRNDQKAAFFAEQWGAHLRDGIEATEIEIRGPTAAPLEKIKDHYRFHLWYFMHSVSKSLPTIVELRRNFPMDEEVVDVLDVDALELR